MKKFLTMLLALVMVLSLAACSSQKGGDVNGGFPASAVDLLTAVWNAYPESEKFSVVGGSLDNGGRCRQSGLYAALPRRQIRSH